MSHHFASSQLISRIGISSLFRVSRFELPPSTRAQLFIARGGGGHLLILHDALVGQRGALAEQDDALQQIVSSIELRITRVSDAVAISRFEGFQSARGAL